MADMDVPSAQSTGRASQQVGIVRLSTRVLAALAAGDVRDASSQALLDIPDWFVAAENLRLWTLRSRQATEDRAAIDWLTGAAVDVRTGLVVGFAGFHGPPDADGMVEIGYEVGPPYRRRGYAHAIIEVLLDRARSEPQVRTVRATISPANTISRALVTAHGFVQVGEQWDDEDGLEIVYEAAVPTGH